MKLVMCSNGHYYDADQYTTCPQCGPKAPMDETVTLKQGSAPSLEETISLVSETVDAGEETVPFFGEKEQRKVVGWLVVVAGEDKGKSFEIFAGKNYVGRGANSDVMLAHDRTVSRNAHAIVVYEPKSKAFLAVPGESKELFYLNDSVVLMTEALKMYDRITVGKTELMFIPLVNGQFDWDE